MIWNKILLNDQFNETPVNTSKRRSSVDIFFSENTQILEEENTVIENQPLMPEIIETLENSEELDKETTNEEPNTTIEENTNNDILEQLNSEQEEAEEPILQETQEEEFVSVSSNKKRRKKKNKNKNN